MSSSYQIIVLFIPVVSFFINIITQLSVNLFNNKCGLLKSEYYGFISGFLFLCFFEGFFSYYIYSSFIHREIISIAITNIIIYCCLGYCYFHFVNLAVTARRIRLLRLIYSHDKGLTYPEILRMYNGKKMIDNRIKRLIGSGQIEKNGKTYFIANRTMLLISEMILLLKLIVIGKKSEFD